MRAQELLHGRRRRRAGRGPDQCFEKLEEFGTGASWEERSRMGDYVGVFVTAQVEADGEAPGIRVRVVVGYHRYTGGVGKSDGDGDRVRMELGCAGKFLGLRGGSEGAIE